MPSQPGCHSPTVTADRDCVDHRDCVDQRGRDTKTAAFVQLTADSGFLRTNILSHTVEHAIDKLHRLGRGKLARDFESFIDDHRARR